MNKAELIDVLTEKMGSDRRQATAAVENVVDTIVRAVHKGDSVTITGFGVFEQRRRAARVARSYGAATLGISRAGSRLADACETAIGLDLPEDSDIFKPTPSRFAYLAILDALALSVAHENADKTRENLRRIRASLTAYHGRTDPQPLGD